MIGTEGDHWRSLSWLIIVVGLLPVSCDSNSWDERLFGDWVEDAEPNEWGGPMTFSIFPDHALRFDIGATCGTGWPKFGEAEVQGDSLFFQIEGYESDWLRWRFSLSGDSLVLFHKNGRSRYSRDSS